MFADDSGIQFSGCSSAGLQRYAERISTRYVAELNGKKIKASAKSTVTYVKPLGGRKVECRRPNRVALHAVLLDPVASCRPEVELEQSFHAGDVQAEAARFGAEAWRAHVAALLPRQPVYASFLPAEAQAAIGACADAARPLRAALEAAGLHFHDHVRIDDGGPVLEGRPDAAPR